MPVMQSTTETNLFDAQLVGGLVRRLDRLVIPAIEKDRNHREQPDNELCPYSFHSFSLFALHWS
jgi:hypothetical protein